jgi:hypothetical protein
VLSPGETDALCADDNVVIIASTITIYKLINKMNLCCKQRHFIPQGERVSVQAASAARGDKKAL